MMHDIEQRRIGSGIDAPAEGGHLQPAAQHLTVHFSTARRTEPGGDRVQRQRRAVAGAGQMRAGRVGECAEFVEVAAAAERRSVSGQHHLADRRI